MNTLFDRLGITIEYLRSIDIPDYLFFAIFVLLSILIGSSIPRFLIFIFDKILSRERQGVLEKFAIELKKQIQISGSFILIHFSLSWLQNHKNVYNFLSPITVFAVTLSVAWLFSRLFHQTLQIYGIGAIQKMGLEADEIVLPLEATLNILIGLVAAIAYAQSQQINLFGLVASLGIVATTVGFAAQNALSQIIGTVVIYLDRPFATGDYIRLPTGLYGRVESIGLRSTKIRTAAKSTLVIIPNSKMADYEIENITRGKKIMVLLYLDFSRYLKDREQALVEQIVKTCTNTITGIDPGSTNIKIESRDSNELTRARVTFFILGSNENSIQLRKRLLELANQKIARELAEHGLEFITHDPTIYVESPVTI